MIGDRNKIRRTMYPGKLQEAEVSVSNVAIDLV